MWQLDIALGVSISPPLSRLLRETAGGGGPNDSWRTVAASKDPGPAKYAESIYLTAQPPLLVAPEQRPRLLLSVIL
jgi:hypothetical protein